MITLTEVMRKKDDVAFAELLNRIRVKEKSEHLSEADKALSQALTEPAQCPTDVLHIFATNSLINTTQPRYLCFILTPSPLTQMTTERNHKLEKCHDKLNHLKKKLVTRHTTRC